MKPETLESVKEAEQPRTTDRPTEIPKNRWWNSKEWKRCGTCGHFGEKSTAAGRCRRHAPTLNGYPVVFSTDPGCGDHKPSGYVSA